MTARVEEAECTMCGGEGFVPLPGDDDPIVCPICEGGRMSLDDEDLVLEDCAECGHEHFDRRTKTFIECPLYEEGCECIYGKGDA